MSDFRITSRERILESYVFDVERRTVELEGDTFTRDVVVHQGAVAIVAERPDGRVALLRQFRATIQQSHLEIPAGTCDVDGEDPLATAQRELLEEVGATSQDWTLVRRFYNSPGWTNQETWVYLAMNCSIAEAAPEGPDERMMEVLWLTREQVVVLLDSPEPFDGTASIGLYAWLRQVR